MEALPPHSLLEYTQRQCFNWFNYFSWDFLQSEVYNGARKLQDGMFSSKHNESCYFFPNNDADVISQCVRSGSIHRRKFLWMSRNEAKIWSKYLGWFLRGYSVNQSLVDVPGLSLTLKDDCSCLTAEAHQIVGSNLWTVHVLPVCASPLLT